MKRDSTLNELKNEDFKGPSSTLKYDLISCAYKNCIKKDKTTTISKWLAIPYIIKTVESNAVVIEHTHCFSMLI